MPFHGSLRYERVRDKESFVGRPVYKLTEPFGYSCDCGIHEGYRLDCEVGYETDFASIPEWILFLNPRDPRWREPSVIHDKGCTLAKTKNPPLTHKMADDILYHAMRENHTGPFAATFIWFFVRLNHIVTRKP